MPVGETFLGDAISKVFKYLICFVMFLWGLVLFLFSIDATCVYICKTIKVSAIIPVSLDSCSSKTVVVSSLVVTGGSSSGLACQGSSVFFVVSPVGGSSSLIVMGVVLPSASCC